MFKPYPLPLAASVLLGLGGSVLLAAPDVRADEDATVLEAVQVSALPMGEDANRSSSSFDLLEGILLFQKSEGTLGNTLNGLPGVHSDTFGGGASRPVIRGQGAPRVTVLSDGNSLFDASSISPDHAVTAEPLLSSKIEVLRGPSTLLYGGGAIGGVVNVLDNKIPTEMPLESVEGFVAGQGNTVADERAGAASLTARASEHIAIHVEGARRDANNYEVNGFTVPEIEGTYAESNNASVGASWIDDWGYLGLAYTYRGDIYGLPGHSHEFESCGTSGSSLVCDDEHDHEHGEDHAAPYVDLDSRRIDLRGEYRQPMDGIQVVRLRSSHTDYRHHEIEDGVIGTTFRHKGYETRIEAEHAPFAGGWHGAVGLQYSDTQFNTQGAEAFMPKTDTRIIGLFAVEHYQLADDWHLELGARHERQKMDPIDDPRQRPGLDDSANSLSAGLTWAFAPDYNLGLSATRSQRLPHAQEAYARGVHLATNTYECGLLADTFTCGGAENNARLETETSHNLGINLRKIRGDFTFDVGLYQNRVDNYIYARTLDQIEDFRLIKYTQEDVEFIGAEAEARYQWTDRFATTLFGDVVKAQFRDGGNELPRIPAHRVGTRINTFWRDFDGELEFYRLYAQDDITGYETRTPGHDMLNSTVSYTFGLEQTYSLFLRASNLLGEEVYNHTSFLADTVPQPGRNLTAGIRMDF